MVFILVMGDVIYFDVGDVLCFVEWISDVVEGGEEVVMCDVGDE